MRTIIFEAVNWYSQEDYLIRKEGDKYLLKYKGKEIIAYSNDYALLPVEEVPQEVEDLIGQYLGKYVAFDRWEDDEATFEYKDYLIVVDIYNDYNI